MANAVALYKRISVQNTHTQAVGRHWNLSLMMCINSLCCLCHCRPHWDQALLRTGIHCRNKSSTQLLHWAFQACFNRKHFYTPTRHKLLAYVKNFSHLLVVFFSPQIQSYIQILTLKPTNQENRHYFSLLADFFFFKALCFCQNQVFESQTKAEFLTKDLEHQEN